MHYKLWCTDCNKFISDQIRTDTQMVKDINALVSRHAFTPMHKTQTKLRIASSRIMKEIKDINGTLDEFGV